MKWEMIWVIPISLLIALFSVWGLTSFHENEQAAKTRLMFISEVVGFEYPDTFEKVFCKSKILIDFPDSAEKMRRYEFVVYDSFNRFESLVDFETTCGDQVFLNQAFLDGYKWQGTPE